MTKKESVEDSGIGGLGIALGMMVAAAVVVSIIYYILGRTSL